MNIRQNEDDEWIIESDEYGFRVIHSDKDTAIAEFEAHVTKIEAADDSRAEESGLTARDWAIISVKYETTAARRYTTRAEQRAIDAWRKGKGQAK